MIILSGARAGQGSDGLDLTGGGISVLALAIDGFSGDGIKIDGPAATANVVAGDTIESNGTDGVLIDDGASGNWVGVNQVSGSESALQGNVISGNTNDGVEIAGMGTTGNVVAGNLIGTDVTGTIAIANYAGVEIDSGASGNVIGASGSSSVTDALERNIISGNMLTGVWITGAGTENNAVAGNYVGTSVTGDTALANGSTYVSIGDDDIDGGILIDGGASNNLIGTSGQSADDAGQRNVLSGNDYTGVIISGAGTAGNTVAGDYIGTTASGEAALGNGRYGDGVDIVNGASGNWIGSNSQYGPEDADQGNVISGASVSSGAGVWIDPTSFGNVVAGNLIGTDAAGTVALGNGWDVYIQGFDNLIGTTGQDGADDGLERNVIASGAHDQILITGTTATGNVVAGNLIGTNAAGNVSLPSGGITVYVEGGASSNWIGVNSVYGPSNADQGNVICGGSQTVIIGGPGTNGNVVAGNLIGFNVDSQGNVIEGLGAHSQGL